MNARLGNQKKTTDLFFHRLTHEETDAELVFHDVHWKFNISYCFVFKGRRFSASHLLFSHAQCENLWLAACHRNGNTFQLNQFSAVYQMIEHYHSYHSMHWLCVIQPPTLQITPRGSHGNSLKKHNRCWRIWLLLNSQMWPAFICRTYSVHKTDCSCCQAHIVLHIR